MDNSNPSSSSPLVRAHLYQAKWESESEKEQRKSDNIKENIRFRFRSMWMGLKQKQVNK